MNKSTDFGVCESFLAVSGPSFPVEMVHWTWPATLLNFTNTDLGINDVLPKRIDAFGVWHQGR
jgi:hypothetical protein